MPLRAPRVALIASLAFNVFLIAAIGAVLFLGAAPGRQGPVPVLRHAAASLNPDDRARFLAILRYQGRIAKPDNQRARMLRLEGWAALGDAAFDRAAIKAKLAQARDLNAATRGAVEDAVVDFAAALPPAERAAFGQSLRTTILRNNPMATGKKP